MSYVYRLRAPMKQTLEEYVSGNMRFYFIKHAVVDKEEDSTPIMYYIIIIILLDMSKKWNWIPLRSKRRRYSNQNVQ